MGDLSTNVRAELVISLKWAAILAIPAAIVLFVVSAILGGIHHWGGIPFFVALAPIFVIRNIFHLQLPEGASFWIVVVLLEAAYFYLVVLLFRLLKLHILCKSVSQKLAMLLKSKPPS